MSFRFTLVDKNPCVATGKELGLALCCCNCGTRGLVRGVSACTRGVSHGPSAHRPTRKFVFLILYFILLVKHSCHIFKCLSIFNIFRSDMQHVLHNFQNFYFFFLTTIWRAHNGFLWFKPKMAVAGRNSTEIVNFDNFLRFRVNSFLSNFEKNIKLKLL